MLPDDREEVLFASAALLAKVGTSDATVIRTAKSLGFDRMDDLRRMIAAELKGSLSQAGRLAATLDEVGGDVTSALSVTFDVHLATIAYLRREVSAQLVERAVRHLADAQHVVAFGIAPSSHIAGDLALQLHRFGLRAATLTITGLLAADGLRQFVPRDRLVVFA